MAPVTPDSESSTGGQIEELLMTVRWRPIAAVIAVGLLLAAGLALLFGQHPGASSLLVATGSTSSVPDLPEETLAPPVWSGPFGAGHAIMQEIAGAEDLAGLRIWLKADDVSDRAPVLVEIRSGPDGPSLRSTRMTVLVEGRPQVLMIEPRLGADELADAGLAYLAVSGESDVAPVFVGMTGDGYASGRSRIGGEPDWSDSDMFFAGLVPHRWPELLSRLQGREGGGGAGLTAALVGISVAGAVFFAVSGVNRRLRLPVAVAMVLGIVLLSTVMIADVGGVRVLAFLGEQGVDYAYLE